MTKDTKNSFAGALQRPDSLDARKEAEGRDSRLVDGRTLRRRNRAEQVTFKTTVEIKALIQSLARDRGTTITEVIETAIQRLAREDK